MSGKQQPIIEILKRHDVKIFVLKSLLFVGILVGLRTLLLYISYTQFFQDNFSIPSSIRLPFLTGLNFGRFINAIMFTSVVGILLLSRKIDALKQKKVLPLHRLLYSLGFLAFFALHYLILYLINNYGYNWMIVLKYLFQLGYIVCLVLAIFGHDFLTFFVKRFRKEILLLFILLVSYSFLILLFEQIWFLLSTLVTHSVGFLLGLTEGPVYTNFTIPTGPRLGVKDFRVAISSACSGIDSLQLFISLYVFLFILDWKIMNRRRMLILFIPGIVGAFIYNIIRVYLLMLVGLYIDRDFAVNTFHTNAGWIFFLIFFIIFWNFGSSYVYDRKNHTESNKQ